MSIFGKLIGATARAALLPVAVVKDAVTLGNAIEGGEPETAKQVKAIAKDVREAIEECEE